MRRRRFAFAFTFAALSLAAWSAELVITEANAPAFYREYTRLTRQPHLVSWFFAMRCTTAPPGPEELEREKQATGPHHRARVHLYANPAAMPMIESTDTQFAVGSVIVKEKLGARDEVTAVGGMIKRAPGYDPDNGDWEYFYVGKPGEFASGRIANCVDCHRAAQKTDHVYGLSFLRR